MTMNIFFYANAGYFEKQQKKQYFWIMTSSMVYSWCNALISKYNILFQLKINIDNEYAVQ